MKLPGSLAKPERTASSWLGEPIRPIWRSVSSASALSVAAGHVSMAFAEAGASLPLIRDGKLRALAVTSSARLPTVPELPPFGEAVGAPDFEAVSWHVLLAPAGTPPEAVERLQRAIAHVVRTKEVAEKLASLGVEAPETLEGGKVLQERIRRELGQWGALIKSAGIRAE